MPVLRNRRNNAVPRISQSLFADDGYAPPDQPDAATMTHASTISKIAREPLVHFLLLGLLMFVLYRFVGETPAESDAEIVVDEARLDTLISRFERTWQRPPTQTELRALVDAWVREEILYREGLVLGLERDDAVVKRRVAQKMDFITEAAIMPPDDEALATWIDENPGLYRIPPRFAFAQVYFNPDRYGDGLKTVVDEARMALKSTAGDEPASVGDASMLPPRMPLSRVDDIARTFGESFADALSELPAGKWSGPVRSSFGVHLVRIDTAMPAELPLLEDIRAAVERDWTEARAREARDALYAALRDRYTVTVEGRERLASDDDAAGTTQ